MYHNIELNKPTVPNIESLQNILKLKILVIDVAAYSVASNNNMKSINADSDLPEFFSFKTSKARETGQALKMNSRTVYLPLIDASPTDPSTMMAELVEAMRLTEHTMKLTEQTCQPYTVITCDQQLYKILVDIKWVNARKFASVILNLEGCTS